MQIIIQAVQEIISGISERPKLVLDIQTGLTLGFSIVFKTLMFLYCRLVGTRYHSNLSLNYALDHINDVMADSVAIVAVLIAFFVHSAWFVDSIGAILIACEFVRAKFVDQIVESTQIFLN